MNVKSVCVLSLLGAVACIPEVEKNAETVAIETTKGIIETQLNAMHDQAAALCAATPASDADGWNATHDAEAIAEMKSAWRGTRDAYEHIEGAIAVLFPDLDAATDERYDGFLAEGGDENLFDAEGVIGVHAIERILYSDSIPEHVVTFESALPGYVAARFPENAEEADGFNALCARLVADTETMRQSFKPLALDAATAYRGVIGSLLEQHEKVALAQTGEDESRYAQYTLADMRANLAGGREIFEAFAMMFDVNDATDAQKATRAAFARVAEHYDGIDGDAIPAVPATWNSDAPSEDDLATAYGQLFTLLTAETSVEDTESLVSQMMAGGDAIGIPQLQ